MRSIVLILSLLTAGVVQAAPVEWTLQNAQFEDGGAAYGSFTFDADTNEYSNINIYTTAGTLFAGRNYDSCTEWFRCDLSGAELAVFVQGSGGLDEQIRSIAMTFDSSLTNEGGTRGLVLGECFVACETFTDSQGVNTDRLFVSGSVTAVPIPAAVWLFGAALALLRFVRRRTLAS